MVMSLKVVQKVSGIVVMVNVSLKVMYVMAQMNSAMQIGALTALMVQMKV
jgi:hypothetical protein